MYLVKPNYTILAASNNPQLEYNYNSPNNLIEIAGRTCYKSENKITKDSSISFIQMLYTNGHHAMMEHSWLLRYYPSIKLSKSKFLNYMQIQQNPGTIVAGNIRAFDEWECRCKGSYELVSKLKLEQIKDAKRWDMFAATVKLICDRGISHELIRHRPVSYAQESTRWCNYNHEKFGKHLSFIIPVWLKDHIKEGEFSFKNVPTDIPQEALDWFDSMCYAEEKYFRLITKHKWSPSQARSVLPNSLKTEIIVTADLREWQHIFNLRTAQSAHEQMRELMIPLQEDFKKLFPDVFEHPDEAKNGKNQRRTSK